MAWGISRTNLILAVMILAATAGVVAFRSWPLLGQLDSRELPKQSLFEPPESLNERPVIPLGILFPEDSVVNLRNGRSRVVRSETRDQPGLPGQGMTAILSSDPRPKISMPIPTTAGAVVAEARQVAEELRSRFPSDPDSLEIAARAQLWLGNSDQAARDWEACLALDPGYAYAHEGLGILASKRGEPDEAVSRYRKALEVSPDAPGALGIRIRLATVLIDQGQLDEAIDLLKPVAQLAPAPIEALVLLGMAHLQSKRWAEARQFYEAAIARHSMHANAHFGLATACRRLGDTEAAARYMERFQELRAGERSIRTDERSQFDDVQEMRERLALMHAYSGRLFRFHKDLSGAERHWRRAAALDPKAVECRQAVAWFYRQSGRPDEAIAVLRELGEIEPDNPAYLLEIGILETNLGRFDEAEATFQTVCDRLPDCADGHASLARLYLRTGRHAERVVALANSAAELEPTVENLLLRAVACERNGDTPGAAAAMECVLMIDPNRFEYRQMHQELLKRLSDSNTP